MIKQDYYKEDTERNEVNSEIQFGGFTNGEAIEKKPSKRVAQGTTSEYNPDEGEDRAAMRNSKSTRILEKAPTKKNVLDPMEN